MTMATRVRCAAAGLFRDKHQATGSWWIVTSPDGETYDLCSAFCLLEFASIGALPDELVQRTPMQAARPHARQELVAGDSGYLTGNDKVGVPLVMGGVAR